MGIGGISVWQLLILLLIVVMVFGTKKLRNMGSDLGAAVRGFRKGMEEEKADKTEQLEADIPPTPASSESSAKNETSAKN